jgi:hypothetical protein
MKVGETVQMVIAGAYPTFYSRYVSRVPDHTDDGFTDSLSFVINPDGTITFIQSNILYIVHGYVLWFAWGILGFMQIASSRYLKVYWKCAMWLHRISGVLIVLMTLALSLVAFKVTDWEVQDGLHVILGFIVLLLCAILAIGGFIARWTMEKMSWNTQKMLWIRFGHRFLGYIMLAVS